MRKISILFVILGFGMQVSAQQDPQVSMNVYNQLAINPGFAGGNDAICATAIERIQWMGFEGAPKTTILGVHMPVPGTDAHGVGLNIINDKIGAENSTLLNLNYAYRLPLGNGKLGIGLGLGMANKAFDGEDLISPETLENPNSNVYSDPAIPHSESKIVFDANFGLFYNSPQLDVGLSTTHLTQPQVKIDESISKSSFVRRHYYLFVRSFHKLPNKTMDFIPSIQMKYDGATAQYDFTAMLQYNSQFWGGLTYRVGDAFVFIAGVTMQNNMRIGLAYDFTTSKLRSYESGSVEVMVSYCFNVKKTGTTKYNSVRFLK